MEFEVSFRETLRQLADAQVRLNSMGKVLDTNTEKGGKMASSVAQAAARVRTQYETLSRQLDRSGLNTHELSIQLAKAQKTAESAFLAMARGNVSATSKLQALTGEFRNLDRLVKDTAAKQAHIKWLEKSASLSADMAGRSQHLRDKLKSLDTAQARVSARLTEYVKAKERALSADAKLLVSNRELQQTIERLDSVEGRRSVTLKRQLQDKRQEISYLDSQASKTSQLRREKEFLESTEGKEQQRLRAQVSHLKQVNLATEQLTQAKALENAQTSRLVNKISLQNQLRSAEAAAAQKVTSADRRQTETLREQIREYERRAKLAAMSNAQLLGLSSSSSKLSRELHINAQAAAMFRAGLAGLNASIGIYTSATVLAATVTYAVAAAMRDTVSVGIEFTDTMARAEAVMMTGSHAITEAGRSMEGLEMQVRALGASTMFTATQVSGALVELGMAGLSSTEAMTSLAPTLDLAAIGNVEMGRAADIATNVMTAFNKTAGEMTGVVDLLAYAITNSNTNLEQLANSISYVGPAAQAAGFGLEDTVAAIQTLANAGIKGSRAGTGLRRMMVNLQNPTARGAKVIEQFNINLTNVDGTTRHLTDILANFNEEMSEVSDAERMAAIVDLFGVRASQSAARLIDASDEVANFRREMELAGGSAQAMREKIEDTLGADWKKLKSAFQDIQLDVFGSFEQQLRSTAAEMTVFLAKQQEINEAMSLQAGFTPEQIASGEGVSELEVLIGTMHKALDIALRLGGAFVAFKAFNGATTAFSALSNQMKNGFIPTLQEVNGRLTQHATVQRNAAMAAAASNSSFTAASVGFRAYSAVVGAATATTYGLATATQWLARAVSTYLGPITMVATAGYAVYSAVKYGFKDSEDYVLDHKARITELEAEYENLGNTIQQIEHTRSMRALSQREADIRTEIEGIREQIEVYEQLSETATGEYAEVYGARLSNLTHQLNEQERALADNAKAQEHLGTSHEQQYNILEQLDTAATQLAEKQDELTAANERVAMGMQSATVQSVSLQREVDALKSKISGLMQASEETASAMVNVFDQMEIAVGKLHEELNQEFRLEGLSDFEKLQDDVRRLNEAREETKKLQRQVAEGETGLGDSIRRNQSLILELTERIARATRDNNLAMIEGQSARDEYLAHFLNEEEQIQATKAKMEELNKEIAVMNALMAMGISVDGERWETLWSDLLAYQQRYEQLTKEDKPSRSSRPKRNQELEEAIRLHDRLRGSYDALGQAADEYAEEQSQLDYLLRNRKITDEQHAKASAHLTEEYKKAIDPIASIRSELYPVAEAQKKYAEQVGAVAAALAAGTIPQDEATAAIEHYGKELEKVVTESDPLAKRLKELNENYDNNHQSLTKLKKDIADITRLHREGSIDGVTYSRMWATINEEMWNVALEANPAARETARAWEDASKRIDETFADAFTGAFDSFSDFSSRILDGFKQLLAELAYQATLKPIVVEFTQRVGGMLGVPGMGTAPGMPGGTGAQNMLSSIGPSMLKSGWSTVSGWFGGPSASSVAAGGVYNNVAGTGYTGALGNATSPGATIGGSGIYTAGAGFLGGYAGTQIGSSVFGKDPGSSYGATGGALAGAKLGSLVPGIGNVIGAGIGALVGGLGDALFGRSKKSYDFDFKQGGHYGVFGDRESELGKFGITSFSDYKLGEQQDALQDLMDQIANFDNTLANAAIDERVEAMRASIEGFTHSGPEDLFDTRLRALIDGSGALVESAIAQIADPEQMANAFLSVLNIESLMQSLNSQIQGDVAAHLEANTNDIQGTAASLTQAINATVLLGNSAKQLNLQFDATAGGAIHYAWAMQEAVGGMDALRNLSNSYFQNYFTAAEREAMHREDLTRTMRELGFELPETREGFRALIEAQNLNTSAGVQNVAALMQLEGAFAQLVPATKEATDAIDDNTSAQRSAADIAREKAQLERELLSAQGKTNALRRLDLEALDKSNRALQLQVWAEQDAAEDRRERERQAAQDQRDAAQAARDAAQAYADAIRTAEQAVQQAYQRFDQQSFDMQIEYLQLMGDAEGALALERERELKTIDESLRPFKERLWALQDEAEAQERARQASQEYAAELINIRSQLSSSLASVSQWIDQRNATNGTPTMNLKEAGEQFARQLVLAENGDRDALQNITQYADRYLAAGESMYASGSGFQRIQEDVLASLKGLPEALSDAEFIVEGFRGIVSNEMATQIEKAIFSSQYKIDTLIEFAADASALPQDLRTILGEQAHRLDSTLNYLLGENQLDNDLRRLALESTNNLVSTVDYITGYTLSESDKLLALSSSNTMTSVIDYVVGSDIDHDSRVLALESSNTYSAMINMILDRDVSEDDRRLALGSVNRYSSLIDYVVRTDIDDGSRRLALSSLNEYDTLIDYATRKDVTSADRKLALTSGNLYLSTLDYIVGKDIDDGSRSLALDNNHQYLSTINYILGKQLSSDNKRLALDTANRFNASVRYITEAEITGDDRRLALSSGQTFNALVKYFSDNRLTKDERKLALFSANQYVTTVDYVRGLDIDATSKALALGATNRYISTVNIVLGSNISSSDRKLALNSSHRYNALIKYVIDSPITGDNRKLALSSGQKYEALIGYYVNQDVSKTDRELALASGNRYLANIEYLVGKDISSNDRKLALNANNKYVSTIDHLIGKKITGDDRRLALSSTNRYLTTVDAVLARGIPSDVRTFGLASSNAIMTTVNGILASKMSGDVRTLALKNSNQFVTTLEAALKDGRITGDERKLLDAKSASVIKTLKTSGSLNLSDDEWAVINAASGSKRLELLADVAFGRTDLDHLKDIDENTRPLAERANNQLTKLNGLVREMAKSTGELVDLNGSMVSLSKAISQLKTVMSSRASDTSVRNAARDTVGKLGSVEGKTSSSATSNRAIANFFDKAGNPNWGLRVSMSYHQDASAVRSFGYHTAKEMRNEFNAEGLRIAVGWGHSRDGAEALAKVFKRIMGANVNGSHFNGLERVPFDGYVAELHKDETVLTAAQANALRGLSKGGYRGSQPSVTRGINPMPLPNFPLLGKSDVAELLRDLKQEVVELRKEQARLQAENNKHLKAANNQRGAATKAQIDAIEKGNKMFKRMEEDKRMEVAKR